MNDAECLFNLLQICSRKTEEFVLNLHNKHFVWLQEIEEEARKMFSSNFNAEPELMPKTPSQKRRRKKRTSILPDENRDPTGRRLSRRRSSTSWSTSVRRLSVKNHLKLSENPTPDDQAQPKRVTRSRAQAGICPPVPEKSISESSSGVCHNSVVQVKFSELDRRSAEQKLRELIDQYTVTKPEDETSLEKTTENRSETIQTVDVTTAQNGVSPLPKTPASPVTPETKGRAAAKLKIASSTPIKANEIVDLICDTPCLASKTDKDLDCSTTPTGKKSDRRSVRCSLVKRQSSSHRRSLLTQYASKRESIRRSIRRSISKKKAMETSSASSQTSSQSSIELIEDDEVTIKIRSETAQEAAVSEETSAPGESTRRSLRSRTIKKIAISNVPEEPSRRVTRQMSLDKDSTETIENCNIKRKSYKRAVGDLSDDELPSDIQERSPPRKKTPSPTCPPSKVVKPPPHLKSFLHTVQKNQLLMMTPGSIGKNIMVKSFIKRNTPLKTDPKEKERQRLEALRKKEETELQRKQKVEESKKRKQEELKLRREERLRKVLQARERVEQLEEEKKKKIEQKFAQIDEKSEKVKEDRMAEEKAKKKITAKKQEEVECRRRQEEEARKMKAKQMEEEEKRHLELMQKKREEEELERQKRFAEAKRLAEQRQAELERERLREQQLLVEKEQERLRAEREKERLEKEKALQQQKELEREQQRKEAEERRRREQQEQEQAKKAKELASANVPVLNVTVDMQNSPVCESYDMTPKSCKAPSVKVNENYGMDLNSDDSTDDESQPRKPIPAWASGNLLTQAIRQQYYNPIAVDKEFGIIDSPKLEDMFQKNKPRYFKRTSSAVWHSPPLSSNRQHLAVGYGLKKY
ncbi:hypothetical protein GDO86_008757 [Hymenochirus boettgeri]|uniref:Inner centromere protein n=1 Tax=Hymenochirus boettgeri TaxID=247094 RepID=A0A8T2J1N6_9PIPI|nr:hypothetical protein GDO86_008757 [Hymenochirus boettgeri]